MGEALSGVFVSYAPYGREKKGEKKHGPMK